MASIRSLRIAGYAADASGLHGLARAPLVTSRLLDTSMPREDCNHKGFNGLSMFKPVSRHDFDDGGYIVYYRCLLCSRMRADTMKPGLMHDTYASVVVDDEDK